VKVLSRLMIAPTLAAMLLLACAPTNAAHRGGGSAYDGIWAVGQPRDAQAITERLREIV
jgi:hypothetical protein